MAIARKISISLLFILAFSLFTSAVIYISLIYKPENAIFLANKLFNDDLIIEYKRVDSNKDFLSPGFNIEGVLVKNLDNKTIIEADKIGIGINILKTFTEKEVNLTFLDLQNFLYINNNDINQKTSIKFIIDKIDIRSETFDLQACNTLIQSKDGNISITNNNGKLNNIIFNELDIYKKYNSDKIYYSATFNLDEKNIDDNNLINLETFLDYKIDLEVHSKGYYDLSSKNLENLNKYIFKKSLLITKTEYPIKNIELVVNSNINNELSGLFSASIPDQDINGSILFKDQHLIIRSKIKFNMNQIANYEQYFELNGLEEFRGVLTLKDDLASLDLETDLSNTKITSAIDDLNKDIGTNLITTINIKDLSKPTYFIKNSNFKSYIGRNNTGYFSFGNDYDKDIELLDYTKGFYIFLS